VAPVFYCYAFRVGREPGACSTVRRISRPCSKRGDSLLGCVQPDGKLIHVQPIGAAPEKFDENATEPYGVGAFFSSRAARFTRLGGK